MVFGALGFSAPWLLIGLLALPVLYFLLRAIPPAPNRRLFPAVVLLLGLKDSEQETDRTPWWLMLLRMMAVAAAIVGFAGPVLNPTKAPTGSGPLLIVVDGSWAQADVWSKVQAQIDQTLTGARGAGRQVALLNLTRPEMPVFQTADAIAPLASGLTPSAWAPAPALPPLPEGNSTRSGFPIALPAKGNRS